MIGRWKFEINIWEICVFARQTRSSVLELGMLFLFMFPDKAGLVNFQQPSDGFVTVILLTLCRSVECTMNVYRILYISACLSIS